MFFLGRPYGLSITRAEIYFERTEIEWILYDNGGLNVTNVLIQWSSSEAFTEYFGQES